ncbi:DMT family transporter [Pseudoroseicyclus tamaricis]|uniref:DMT family transporter n=1 Tax=Pseudoroseicyclus tamaricis TaxID=2705421 RepID=A0A6B2JMT3_9RHOB|nr:DMT family transporter [Pseudoroseicyclus tamaricis]NDV02911.1 DMT family transporter [Pseudoroseicyclus tamaricis]
MQPLRGILLKLLSVTLFVGMATIVKATAGEVPPGEAVFFRSLFAIPVILGWLTLQGQLSTGMKTTRPLGHIWRGVIGTSAMALSFTALGLLPLPEATAIGYAAPLLVVVLAALILREKVGVFRLSTVALGMVGVVIVLAPNLSVASGGIGGQEGLGAMVALTGAFCAALAQIQVRRLVQVEGTATIVFWFSVTATCLSLLTLPWGWRMPSPTAFGLLVLGGLLGGFGQICLTSSYRFADASLIAPFDYASMLLALLVGFFLFAEVPTATVLFGAGLIVLAGVGVILRERHLGLKRARERRASRPGGPH